MLARRIIPCLDVRDGVVVKGVQFKNHVVLGGIVEMAKSYRNQGADELVFYDITASAEGRLVSLDWVTETARQIDIPFCVAGGIRSVKDARRVLHAGADKVSINTPALERPELISELADAFGGQCVVVGIDSMRQQDGSLVCWQHTGKEETARSAGRETLAWVSEAQKRGAGEIVLNTMNQDGTGKGYDITQLAAIREVATIPMIASGGAGAMQDFADVFTKAQVDGALAAGVFHRKEIHISDLKTFLRDKGIAVRP